MTASLVCRCHARPYRAIPKAFTLVELLVIIGIISLLISILLPALGKARESANRISCASRLRQLNVGLISYTIANKGWLPAMHATSAPLITDEIWVAPEGKWVGHGRLYEQGYIKTLEAFFCPTTNQTLSVFSYDFNIPKAGVIGGPASNMNSGYEARLNYTWRIANPPFNPPSKTYVLLTDVCRGTWVSGHGGFQDGNPNKRSKAGWNVAYSDGHVRWVGGKEVSFPLYGAWWVLWPEMDAMP